MKGIFLNLPNKEQIMRRYMCSYNSPTFLFQPIELIALAGILREWKGGTPILIDAIAEQLNEKDVLQLISEERPEFIITICGFECFEDDMKSICDIKEKIPDIPIILFGHYATEFPEKIMEEIPVDYIIHGEPDLIFSDLLDHLLQCKELSSISGLSYRNNAEIIHQKGHSRIPNPNELPMPAYDILKNDLYKEPFFPQPYGLLQSARGCPYQCNYCVKSYGTKLTTLTPENMIRHLEQYIHLFKIESFRFIDDTFTATPNRVIKFCQLLIEKDYRLKWSCLSRSDTLNREMLQWMKKAGCVRIYIGMETGSQKILDYYNKRVDLKSSLENIRYCKSLGFEIMGFFMVGAPIETKSDVNESIAFAIKADFDLITVGELITYPGTELYESLKEEIDFSLIPYKNEFKRKSIETNAYQLQRYFFRRFYFRPKAIYRVISRWYISLLGDLVRNIVFFTKYIFSESTNKKRKDLI